MQRLSFQASRPKGNLYHRFAQANRPSLSHANRRFSSQRLIKPPALRKGDTIALVAPATPISDEDMKETIREIEQLGFKTVQYAPTHWHKKHYLSDTDQGRAMALNKAFANPKVKAIFAVQGGAGTFRPQFLKALNWKLIRQNPKILVGYSDISFLHFALGKKAHFTSFHGGIPYPSVHTPKAQKTFWTMLTTKKPQYPPKPILPDNQYRCIVKGKAQGEILCSNMAMLSSAIGTPYEPDFKGKILILEEWDDYLESVDRLLSQLSHKGVWKQINGLILGQMNHIPRDGDNYGLSWDTFMREVTQEAQKAGIPIGYNFPVGHITDNHLIPQGVKAHFNSETGELKFLESPVSASSKRR